MTENHNDRRRPRRVLPVVGDMCRRIDLVFVRYVGPVAEEIAREAYESWSQAGNTGPSSVPRYIQILSEYIADEQQRISFSADAQTAMRQTLERRSSSQSAIKEPENAQKLLPYP